jgi:hypothetical protein
MCGSSNTIESVKRLRRERLSKKSYCYLCVSDYAMLLGPIRNLGSMNIPPVVIELLLREVRAASDETNFVYRRTHNEKFNARDKSFIPILMEKKFYSKICRE